MNARTWTGIVLAILVTGVAEAETLQEVQEMRRHLQYDRAALRLGQLLPDLEGEPRAQGLLLMGQLATDPRDARRYLNDAARLATQPETRGRIALELAALDYARGSYRAVQSRLSEFASEPEAALWLGLAAAGVDETDDLQEILAPAARADMAQALLGWGALRRGDPAAALAVLEPLAAERQSTVLPSALLWKCQAEAALGERDAALATGAELRERFGDTPESRLVQATLNQLHGWEPAPPPVAVPTERIALQLGAFEDRGNALRFRAGLPTELEPVRIQAVPGERGPLYRILAGSFDSRDEAESWARTMLVPRGLTWQVVRVEEARPR